MREENSMLVVKPFREWLHQLDLYWVEGQERFHYSMINHSEAVELIEELVREGALRRG